MDGGLKIRAVAKIQPYYSSRNRNFCIAESFDILIAREQQLSKKSGARHHLQITTLTRSASINKKRIPDQVE
ncbi:Hypothetical predicted protein [Octopus vulgaris]|uniref:Uncharacterized protein n=1 Tax=Octopus vulgaris TaxID=6645 RepID=A0AA36AXJ9_OCTVU|nr:Hypothetical predicted protein [Octopus vulgaris]